MFIVSYSSDNVHYVDNDGYVNYNWYNNVNSVRRSGDGRRNKVGATPKLESHHQKNKQPFSGRKCRDKYKGKKYYDRR